MTTRDTSSSSCPSCPALRADVAALSMQVLRDDIIDLGVRYAGGEFSDEQFADAMLDAVRIAVEQSLSRIRDEQKDQEEVARMDTTAETNDRTTRRPTR